VLSVAHRDRIAAGSKQFSGLVGLGAGLGEADHPCRADPHHPFPVIDLIAEQPRLRDTLGPGGRDL
jgi:hypothetical protein